MVRKHVQCLKTCPSHSIPTNPLPIIHTTHSLANVKNVLRSEEGHGPPLTVAKMMTGDQTVKSLLRLRDVLNNQQILKMKGLFFVVRQLFGSLCVVCSYYIQILHLFYHFLPPSPPPPLLLLKPLPPPTKRNSMSPSSVHIPLPLPHPSMHFVPQELRRSIPLNLVVPQLKSPLFVNAGNQPS